VKLQAPHALLRGSNEQIEHKHPQKVLPDKNPIFKERPREMYLRDVSYRPQTQTKATSVSAQLGRNPEPDSAVLGKGCTP